MKRLLRFLTLTVLGLALSAGPLLAATTPAGHWEGAITLPGTALAIRVDLEQAAAGAWAGTIDIPVQGLRGFKLGEVAVKDAAVSFIMPGVPGDPKFAGALSADAKTISGDFAQGGQKLPFKLERRPKPAGTAGETPAKGVPGKGLAGHWQGSLKPTPVIELRLVLDITDAAGALGGVILSVDQGGARIPITLLSEKDGAVRIEAQSVGGTFDGKLSADGSEIAGEWRQGGGKLPLIFKRLAKAPGFSRPQEPGKPYPYNEEEVSFSGGGAGVTLSGTLTLPRGAGPHPAVVLLSGSGPQDRDEAIMGHRPFLVLADHLTRQGIAVLRYDDRGVGGSSGSFAMATHEDFTADALAAVTWLKTRREIDPKRLGLVGHSEGGIVAPLAAVQRPEDVAFLVLLAGVGVPVEELLVRQGQDIARVMGADTDMLQKSAETQKAVFTLLREDLARPELERKLRDLLQGQMAGLTDGQRHALGVNDAMLEGQLQTVLTPWFRKLLGYDPRPTLRQVQCPVLAVNGEKDLQVAARANLEAIASALKAGGNPHVETLEFPGLNHLFQTCTTGAVAEYGQIEETFAPAALEKVSGWLLREARR
ncbi:MAG: alpha/beta hydrolase family protein [Limisphaerales bacterium]